MSYWLYIQAGINLLLVGALVSLWVGFRRVRSQGEWRKELTPLVETLGELLIEIERLSARDRVSTSMEIPAEMPADATPVAAAPATAEPLVAEPAGALSSVPMKAASAPARTEPVAPSTVEPVLALAAQGVSAEEIARRLGRPIGEVSLVLGLRSSGVALTA